MTDSQQLLLISQVAGMHCRGPAFNTQSITKSWYLVGPKEPLLPFYKFPPGAFLRPHCIVMNLHCRTVITDFWALVPSWHLTRWANVKISAFSWTTSCLRQTDLVLPFLSLRGLEDAHEQIKQQPSNWIRYQLGPQSCFLSHLTEIFILLEIHTDYR